MCSCHWQASRYEVSVHESDEQPEQVHLISTLPIACGGCGNDDEDDGDNSGYMVVNDVHNDKRQSGKKQNTGGATCYQRFRIHSPGEEAMCCMVNLQPGWCNELPGFAH